MKRFENKGVCVKVGHAYAEYADADENAHTHYPHMNICQKWQNFGPKWASLVLFSILSAQNTIIVHPTWFYPSSEIKNNSPESQYFGQQN